VRDTQTQMKLPGVPPAKQGREVPPRWEWTEASVWTERMLATLERGIKGGKWFSLIDKVWNTENLHRAAQKVARDKSEKKPDGRKCRRYLEQSSWRLPRLQETLKRGDYQPQPAQRVWIPKLGSKELRPLGIPPVENRVVEMAIRNVIEPIFDHDFAAHSYGFRPGRGAKDALRRVQQLLDDGKTWVVDADIKGYFDNIPQDQLMAAVKERISDGALLELIERFLQQGVMESGKGWIPTLTGTPQGAVLSPLLANTGISFRARLPMAAQEKPRKVSRSHPGQDPQTAKREHERNYRRGEPDTARLVCLLQAQRPDDVPTTGQMGPTAAENDPAQTTQRKWTGARQRSPALAQCLLRGTWADLLNHSPSQSEPILAQGH
jgi:hypothetical protein